MVVGSGADIHVVQAEVHVGNLAGVSGVGRTEGQRGGRGVVPAAFTARTEQFQRGIVRERIAAVDVLEHRRGARSRTRVLDREADGNGHSPRVDAAAAVQACAVGAKLPPAQDLGLAAAAGGVGIAAVAEDGIIAGRTVDGVVATTALKQVVAILAVDHVIVAAAVQRVVADAAQQGVFTRFAVDHVIACAGINVIVTRRAQIHDVRLVDDGAVQREAGVHVAACQGEFDRAAALEGRREPGVLVRGVVFLGTRRGHGVARSGHRERGVGRGAEGAVLVGGDRHALGSCGPVEVAESGDGRDLDRLAGGLVEELQTEGGGLAGIIRIIVSVEQDFLPCPAGQVDVQARAGIDQDKLGHHGAAVLGDGHVAIDDAVASDGTAVDAGLRARLHVRRVQRQRIGQIADAGLVQRGVTIDGVVAVATEHAVVVATGIDQVGALARMDGVVAATGVHDIHVAGLAGQDGVVVVDAVAFRVADIVDVDQVIARSAVDDAVGLDRVDGLEMHVRHPDLLVGAVSVVIVDLDARDRTRYVVFDRSDLRGGHDRTTVVDGVTDDRIARDRVVAGRGDGNGNDIAICVIGTDRHTVDVVVVVGAAINVIDAEIDVLDLARELRAGRRERQGGGRGIVPAAFAAGAEQLQRRVRRERIRRVLVLGQ